MTAFFLTSVLANHPFETTEFWDPFCVRCHEKEFHPIHNTTARQITEVCGYDPCHYCSSISDPDRGVRDDL